MNKEKLSEYINMAEAAQAWLRQRGSRVTDIRVFMKRPMLEITCPPSELERRAARIAEHSFTGTRFVWTASLEGCQIIWR